MRAVWKYQVPIEGVVLEVPKGARILDVQWQGNDRVGCMWVEVDPDAEKEDRTFVTVGTGHPMQDGLEYIGTYQVGAFVWHIYEEKS